MAPNDQRKLRSKAGVRLALIFIERYKSDDHKNVPGDDSSSAAAPAAFTFTFLYQCV
jgi:hypothetical protein